MKVNSLTKAVALITYCIALFTLGVIETIVVSTVVTAGVLLFVKEIRGKAKFAVKLALIILALNILLTRNGEDLTEYVQSNSLNPLLSLIKVQGIKKGVLGAARFAGIVISSIALAYTSDPGEIAYTLMKLGLPYRFGYTLLAAFRFMPLFDYDLKNIRIAQQTRGLTIEATANLRKLKEKLRYLLSPLVFQSISKAETLAISMENRGFGLYKKRTYIEEVTLTALDYILIGVFAAIAIGLILI